MEKTTKELVLENEAYRQLKNFLAGVVMENINEEGFYTYFFRFLLHCEDTEEWATLAGIAKMAEKRYNDPLKMIYWLSNVQHFMFPKDVETSTID